MQLVNRKIYLPAALVLASVTTGLALVNVRTNSGGPPIKSNEGAAAVAVAATAVSASTTSNPNPQLTEAVVLTLLRTGFDPAQITLPSGDYVLAVYNRSGIREITWQLHRENGERLHEVRTPRHKLDWVKRIHLPPGVYLLTAENQPEWRCRLTVTSR